MNTSETPESDAAEIVQTFKGLPDCRTGRVPIKVSRKLELERNQLKALLVKGHGAVTISRNGYIEELERKLEEHRLALASADEHNNQLVTMLERAREQLNGR
jgi:hypothetical protein